MEKVYIFCDGGCRGNQFDKNIGGFGAVIQYNDHVEELSGTRVNTTNNVMEITSCIMALRYLPKRPLSVEIIMDSSYVISGINEWVSTWLDNGWVTAKKKPVENRILWEELLELIFLIKDIKFIKCKGHADNDGNNRADYLANKAMNELDRSDYKAYNETNKRRESIK